MEKVVERPLRMSERKFLMLPIKVEQEKVFTTLTQMALDMRVKEAFRHTWTAFVSLPLRERRYQKTPKFMEKYRQGVCKLKRE